MSKYANIRVALLSLASAFVLGACGGGGDSGTSAPSVSAFPLQAGYKALVQSGQSNNFSVAGTCLGTATFSASAATPAAFEGVSGVSSVSILNASLTNCSVASISITSTGYYDANYSPIGSVSPPNTYAKFLSTPPALPVSVKVGDVGTFSSLTIFSDSTKATVVGQLVLSYVVEADTSDSAIVNLISKGYSASNVLLVTQQTRYRISAAGTLSIVSIDLQMSSTSTSHFLITRI